jgi:hypothetical protein
MSRQLAVVLAGCVLLVVPGCSHRHRVMVTAGEIVHHAPELRAHQQATLEVRDEVEFDGGTRGREVVRADQTVTIEGEPKTIGSLAAVCPGPDCIIGGVSALPIELRRYDKREVGHALGATAFGLGVAAIVASVACGLGCADGSPEKRASEVTLIGAGVVISGGLVWLLITCATGDRCRD